MNKVLVIARREYREVLRTKVFWISMLLPILIMVIAVIVGVQHAGPMDERKLGEFRKVAHFLGAFIYLFIMFMSTLTPSQMLVTSLIEEKSSRVVEVLLSAVSPLELMAGKILGLFAVGVTTAMVYVIALGVVAGSTSLLQAPNATLLALFLVYYLLGFAMYASLFAGIGAAFNTLKDAQTIMMPLSLLLVLPIMFWMNIAQHPNGLFAVALSIFPATAPTVMIVRIAVLPSPPWRDIAGSLLLLAGSVPLIVWAAAKIFRTGVLLYGKPPKLAEILRWVRNA
jgi:ABC-2 type transport system permease protein